MPVHKCSNGKYRIGEGKCMYDSKEKAEKAYKAYLAQKHDNKNEEKKASEMSLQECIENRYQKIKQNHPEMSDSEARNLARQRCETRPHTNVNELRKKLDKITTAKNKINEELENLKRIREDLKSEKEWIQKAVSEKND